MNYSNIDLGHGSRRKSEIFVGQKAHAFFEFAETTG